MTRPQPHQSIDSPAREPQQPGSSENPCPILDTFSVDCKPGKVMGTQSLSGSIRQGADVEKVLSIDNGALRIQPLITPGWARAGVAYGPYKREPGLALSVFMLNGHNTSEGNSIEETLKGRFARWIRGGGSYKEVGNRLVRWGLSRYHRNRMRQFYRWLRNHKGRFKDGHLKENLVVGWFPEASPPDPTAVGNGIVIQAHEPGNGALCTRAGDRLTPAFRNLQNLQTYYIIVLRDRGAAYYAASLPNAHGLGAYPYMRLVGIDTHGHEDTVYAGVHQGAMGQVGFRVDSRVYGIQAKALPELSHWYGTAHAADTFVGHDRLDQLPAEVGGRWRVLQGSFAKTSHGLVAESSSNLALLTLPAPAGAIHVLIHTQDLPSTSSPGTPSEEFSLCALLWRTQDENNTWALHFAHNQCQLKIKENGQWSPIATDSHYSLQPNACNTVQILDKGELFSLYLNGNWLFETWFSDLRLSNETSLGLLTQQTNSLSFRDLESHPRDIPIPSALKMGEPWYRSGSQVLLSDSFFGSTGQDLAEHVSEVGKQPWRREIGNGRILLTAAGSARVDASPTHPNDGRLAYTVSWGNPTFADLSVDILPPGTDRHQKEKGRGGLIFWQDSDHYIIVNNWLDDTFKGSSMSTFFHIDGFEEIYDAVWSNIGERIYWGERYTLRVMFDGLNFLVYVNGEPILYRSLQDIYPRLAPLTIQRVGIVANWEWGNDTGSTFSQFIGKC